MRNAENLNPAFFDLSSGDAGAVLQKLRSYDVIRTREREAASSGLSFRLEGVDEIRRPLRMTV